MKRTSMTLTCESCGADFHPEYGREKTSKYCSRKCYLTKRWGETPAKACPTCGTDISRSGRRARKFCSVECRAKWQSAEVRGADHPNFIGLIRYGRDGAYRARLVPGHPNADSKGYVMEHRLVAEASLGRLLDRAEVVHHIDGDPTNNHPANLEVMSKSEHDALHSSQSKGRPRSRRLP